MSKLSTKASALNRIPQTWQTTRREAVDTLLLDMALAIEELHARVAELEKHMPLSPAPLPPP